MEAMNSRMTPRGMPLGALPQQYLPGPNAALLIDFDNVTMGIRSDLGKELRALLNSDVIRGKVAVQRAYADWRRYPQYIVPLAENSVDLIFAPAYGSAKKNATDLRMAIDAIELVFTRPEIGTFILMTGDSDFSSCVLKLKEYGKYVIGVGMRESSSDLLIQNCDEYYSYHALSGLTRAGEVEESKEDPWVLVKRAVQQMVKNGDVMRTDRLKQVMLDIDPGFDEKKVGYSKFSRFVSEAASKDLLRLRKTENGQYEILPAEEGGGEGGASRGAPAPRSAPRPAPVAQTVSSSEEGSAASAASAAEAREKVVERIVAEAEASAGNGRRRGRGRGRDDRRPRAADEARPSDVGVVQTAAVDADSEPPAAPSVDEAPAAEAAIPAVTAAAVGEEAPITVVGDINGAYSLLQEAVRRLVGKDGKAARDGDVKRRMLEISRDFDEGKLGFPKFTRFLRQAHDAEVIDLTRNAGGNYEVALPASGKKLPPPRIESAPATQSPVAAEKETAPGRSDRGGRGRGRGRGESPAPTPAVDREGAFAAASAAETHPEAAEAPVVEAPEAEGAQPETPKAESGSTPAERSPEAVAAPVTPAAPAIPTPGLGALRGRRGGRIPLEGPPPILPGQAIPSPRLAASAAAPVATPAASTSEAGPDEQAAPSEPVASEAPAAEQPESGSRSRRGRRGGRGSGRGAAAGTGVALEAAAAEESAPEVVEVTETIGPQAQDDQPATGSSRRGRGRSARGRGRGTASAVQESTPEVVEAPAVEASEAPSASSETEAEAGGALAPDVTQPAPRKSSRSKRGQAASATEESVPKGRWRGKSRVAPVVEAATSPLADLGLPQSTGDIRGYLAGYAGVGAKTADSLVDRFGEGVFEALQGQPGEVVKLLGERRARSVLDQWIADFDRRSADRAPKAAATEPAATPAKKSRSGSGSTARKTRGSGGRKGSSTKE